MRKIVVYAMMTLFTFIVLTLAGSGRLHAGENLHRLLKGRYGSSGSTFTCIGTPPAGIDPVTFELLADARQANIGAGTQIFEFDGQGGFSFVVSKFLQIATNLLQAGDIPVTVIDPAAPFVSEGTYTVNPDRSSFTFEYAATLPVDGGVIEFSALHGEGFIGPNGHTLLLGIGEPQIRDLTLIPPGVPIAQQLCNWDITAVRLSRALGAGGGTDCSQALLGLPCP